MTSLLNIAGNIPVVAEAGGQSLRFEDGDSAYLSWTPASTGNRNTWTWSGWVKRGNLTDGYLFGAGDGGNRRTAIYFDSNKLTFINRNAPTTYDILTTSAVFRDTSAYYHIVAVRDSTNSTSSDRLRIYVNGERVTSFSSSTYPSTISNGYVGVSTYAHEIGRNPSDTGRLFDGYLANVAFIDGTALDPTSFGEYDGTLWKPKSDTDIQALTFGTNGFYLPFKQTTEAEGFSTVTYTGNGSTQAIEGVGFEPDFVWIKSRNNGYAFHSLTDSVRGVTKFLYSNSTAAETTSSVPFKSFDSSGFTVASDTSTSRTNISGENYVAWCWDAGSGSAVSNTDGSITSTVKANTAKGFGIVSYTGTGTAGETIGHGLSSAPEMIIVKSRTEAVGWYVYHSSVTSDPENRFLRLDTTAAVSGFNDGPWDSTAPSSSVITLGDGGSTNRNTENYIAYCFHSVSGYSSIGSYSGTGAAGNSITGLGFEPAWIMVKRTDNTSNWSIYDNTRTPVNPRNLTLYTNLSNAETTSTSNAIDFDNDGFTLLGTGTTANASGGTYIYMAFADTRDATFFGDTSGNSNNWTPNALNNTDVVPDSPVSGGNFATLNPLYQDADSTPTYSEGNLRMDATSSSWFNAISTFKQLSGKWYSEFYISNVGTGAFVSIGTEKSSSAYLGSDSNAYGYHSSSGNIYNNSSATAYGNTFTTGDIIGVALDLDAGDVYFYKNGTIQNSGTAAATGLTGEWFVGCSASGTSGETRANFGQDSSFAGTKTPQGNTDDNGVGDFYYAPPSGYLALTTGNLPAATITAPDEYFNTVLWAGNGSSQSITGVNFQPSWLWVKNRSGGQNNYLQDSVRGATNYLVSNNTGAENQYSGLGSSAITSFDSDGFSLGTDAFGMANTSGQTYVAWNWLAGNGTVSNTDGSITSTVSANTDAGFSIVNYAADGTTTSTVGHGLSSAPEIVIHKNRDGVSSWLVNTTAVDGSNDYLFLNTTAAKANWSAASPTSSVFTSWNAPNGNEVIAFCFHSVESYSKIGTYTGNGSTDGTYVHLGFRPSWIMVKRTNSTGNWQILDNKRDPENADPHNYLYANLSNAEASSATADYEFLSNGYKLRDTGTDRNASGSTYIFIAFAEAPFSKANAR